MPDLDLYIPRLAKLHHAALNSLQKHPRLLADHIEFLELDIESLLNLTEQDLSQRFATKLRPLAEVARLQGFSTQWTANATAEAPSTHN